MAAPRLVAFVAAAASAAVVSAAAPQQPVFHAGARTVPVYVTVTGGDGRLVTTLTRDDFEIFDDGRPQPITAFDAGIQPIRVVVMLDMSGSMSANLVRLRSAAVQMFTRLLPDDLARVGGFGDRISISPTWTRREDELIRAVYDLTPGGPTPLWSAIDAAMTALAPSEGRRVVLVLSDGRDSAGGFSGRTATTLERVSARAQNESFMIYGIGLASADSPPDPGLQQLALESGGGYLALGDAQRLGPAFAQVADELHRQYLIGFVPAQNDGKVHRIDVRVRGPQMTARARRTYVAPGGGGGR